ncbi:MAG: TIGR04423 family type III CRISPR-associated protein [Saprospiraceae bacterium]|uniref:TIGR04423 family type III CRISPR-associated protein n=1 Tax=Candidatus Opimibacter skivensis TaxID=2982028 RepID=A0A9D7XR14_9BACT|nr:TIGR04423 family type III CRISPR-associated protein [Candidatus Opimibacter skivensis]
MQHKKLDQKEWEILDALIIQSGYLWYSDKRDPYLYSGKTISLVELLTELPHVIEGWLVTKEDSYCIRYIDGKYYVHQYDIAYAKMGEEIKYPAHKLDANLLVFRQGFAMVDSNVVHGLSQKMPSWRVFTGFE